MNFNPVSLLILFDVIHPAQLILLLIKAGNYHAGEQIEQEEGAEDHEYEEIEDPV